MVNLKKKKKKKKRNYLHCSRYITWIIFDTNYCNQFKSNYYCADNLEDDDDE